MNRSDLDHLKATRDRHAKEHENVERAARQATERAALLRGAVAALNDLISEAERSLAAPVERSAE